MERSDQQPQEAKVKEESAPIKFVSCISSRSAWTCFTWCCASRGTFRDPPNPPGVP